MSNHFNNFNKSSLNGRWFGISKPFNNTKPITKWCCSFHFSSPSLNYFGTDLFPLDLFKLDGTGTSEWNGKNFSFDVTGKADFAKSLTHITLMKRYRSEEFKYNIVYNGIFFHFYLILKGHLKHLDNSFFIAAFYDFGTLHLYHHPSAHSISHCSHPQGENGVDITALQGQWSGYSFKNTPASFTLWEPFDIHFIIESSGHISGEGFCIWQERRVSFQMNGYFERYIYIYMKGVMIHSLNLERGCLEKINKDLNHITFNVTVLIDRDSHTCYIIGNSESEILINLYHSWDHSFRTLQDRQPTPIESSISHPFPSAIKKDQFGYEKINPNESLGSRRPEVDLYKTWLQGVLIDLKISPTKQLAISTYRKEHNITDGEHIEVLKSLNISQAAFESMKINEDEPISEKNNCVVCMSNRITVILLPCGHLCVCQTCASKLLSLDCPICRGKIQQIKTVFYV